MHRIQWVMANTDPKLFGWQIDVLHNWSGRVRFLNAMTHQPDISVWALAQAEQKRVMGWHIKDGFRNTAQTGTWTGPAREWRPPYFQTFLRTPTFTDAVISGEGDLGAGPGPGHPTPTRTSRLQVHVREPEGPEPAPLHRRERQRPRPDNGASADPDGRCGTPRRAPRRCSPGG